MYPKSLFSIISFVALAVVGGVSAQDSGTGYVFKCTNPGQVALTFDDGPSTFTPKLLGFLAKNNTPATFFVLGVSINQPGGAKTLKAAFDAGHQIALHSNTHADMNTLTPAKIKSEYTINLEAVEKAIGKKPLYARPPFGNCNEACGKVLRDDMGLTVTQWNCDSNDWRYETSPKDQPKTFTNIADIINPSDPKKDSFITLQHDIKDYSVDLVPKIIDLIAGKGYKFVTVEECTGKGPSYEGGAAVNATSPASTSAASSASTPAADPYATSSAAAAGTAPAGPGYLDASSSASSTSSSSSSSSSSAPASGSGSATPNSAGKVASTFSLTLICLALGLLY